MIYKFVSCVAIVLGGTISGALAGSVSGPVQLHLTIDDMGGLGACIGGFLALAGCKLAIERSEARERNRELIRALEGRLIRMAKDSAPSAPGA